MDNSRASAPANQPPGTPESGPKGHDSRLANRITRRQALRAAAGLAAATPLASLLQRIGPAAAQDATTVAPGTPTPYLPPYQMDQVTLPSPDLRYPGSIGVTAADSDPPIFAPLNMPPEGAPNVLLILVDDAGFGQFGVFGGATPTPAADALASAGLRYNRFHTTALCSPTRAALITGRNHHDVAFGNIGELASGYDGYTSIIPRSAATIARTLQLNGYSTAWFGKNHNVPSWEQSPTGPFDHWPTGQGFDHFYGFVSGESNQWQPLLFEGTSPVEPWVDNPGYILNEDLADKAIAWIRDVTTLAPDKPYFGYYCPGATHAPHHVPSEWSDRFIGQFDEGYEKYREATFQRQKQLGVVPQDAQLTPRPEQIPAWDSFSPELRKLMARQMEVFAGYTAQTDYEIGRVIDYARSRPGGENTLIFYIIGDNGSSAEGGLTGTINEMTFFNAMPADDAFDIAHMAEWGDPSTYPHFAVGWAWAMCTPFQWTKQVASHFGGTRNPMIVSWPAQITDKGGLRSQFHHVVDIAPTILEAASISQPTIVDGFDQKPYDGISMLYTFGDAVEADRRTQQYFEILTNRAIYDRGWTAVCKAILPWQVTDITITGQYDPFTAPWELYNIDQDFSQANDLASQEPEKLRELQDLFFAVASANNVLPLQWNTADALGGQGVWARPTYWAPGQTTFTFYPGMTKMLYTAAPNTYNRSFRLTANAEIPQGGAEGVLVALGGVEGGWSFSIQNGKLVFHYNHTLINHYSVVSDTPVPAGKVTLVADFAYDGGGMGKGAAVTLAANGKDIGKGRVDKTVPLLYGPDGFDIGGDYGSAVSPDYKGPFLFTGKLEQVTIDLL